MSDLKDTGQDDNNVQEDNSPANYQIGSFLPAELSITVNGSVEGIDYKYFTRLLASSISLSKLEKKRILDSAPTLSGNQFSELIRIFEEERKKFANLSKKHVEYLQKLDKQHYNDWLDLESTKEQTAKKEEDDSKADEIRKQLGL